MALYFLKNSPTYVKRTEKSIFRRREVICQYLNNVFKAGRSKDDEVYEKIGPELATEGIEVTPEKYHGDKVVLRSAFLWLNEKDEKKKAEIAERRSPASGVIKYLAEDNLRSWADLT